MTNVIVFEGDNEVLVVAAASVNAFIREWFLEGGRSLDHYNIYVTDVLKGFAVSASVRFNDSGLTQDFDINELMPADLREGLVEAKLLTL